MFVRLRDQLVELPTAQHESEVDGRIAFSDAAGTVVAWFDRLDVLAYSPKRDLLGMDVAMNGHAATPAKRNGHDQSL